MKFYIHYESPDSPFTYKAQLDEGDESTLVEQILEKFVRAFNKAHVDGKQLSADSLALSFGGKQLKDDAKIKTVVPQDGADLYAIEAARPFSSFAALARVGDVIHSQEKRFRCGNTGCSVEFTEKENSDTACQFHPGNPKFHEGNKGYDCCWKKRVISFDEFLNLPGCTVGRHKKFVKPVDVPKPPPSKIDNVPVELEKSTSADGKEVYRPAGQSSAPKPKDPPKPWVPPVEIPDPVDAVIAIDTPCLHQGCIASYKDASSRQEECVYHPGSPVFHEGSKGWQCCKSFTLIFEDFLNAPGCTKGKHKFVPDPKKVEKTIRRDFYQMGDFAVVNFYEKNANKEKSVVTFGPREVKVSLLCADGTVYEEIVPLSNEVIPEQSKFEVLGTKVEIKLRKKAVGDWAKL